jgi:protein-tyrosine phosphatase
VDCHSSIASLIKCVLFLTEQARADKARVLVHCMSGQSRYAVLGS